MNLIKLIIGSAVVAATMAGANQFAVNTAAADSPSRANCTLGDVKALFQAMPIARKIEYTRGEATPGLPEALSQCGYSLFLDGETFTFCESDMIIGSVTYLYPKDQGSRVDAIAEFDLIVDHLWINGEKVELMHTTNKYFDSPSWGPTIYQTRAFIAQLPPGEYVSYWLSTHPDFGDLTATVNLQIVPGALCN